MSLKYQIAWQNPYFKVLTEVTLMVKYTPRLNVTCGLALTESCIVCNEKQNTPYIFGKYISHFNFLITLLFDVLDA